MLGQTTLNGKIVYFLDKPVFKAKKGIARLIGVETRGQDTLLMLKYDNGTYEDILISQIVEACRNKGIEIKRHRG
jgi:hypothetical protein